MDSYMIYAHTKELAIGKSDQLFNLYVFNIADNKGSNSLQQQFAVSSNVVVDDNIWHNRLDHPSISKTDVVIDYMDSAKE